MPASGSFYSLPHPTYRTNSFLTLNNALRCTFWYIYPLRVKGDVVDMTHIFLGASCWGRPFFRGKDLAHYIMYYRSTCVLSTLYLESSIDFGGTEWPSKPALCLSIYQIMSKLKTNSFAATFAMFCYSWTIKPWYLTYFQFTNRVSEVLLVFTFNVKWFKLIPGYPDANWYSCIIQYTPKVARSQNSSRLLFLFATLTLLKWMTTLTQRIYFLIITKLYQMHIREVTWKEAVKTWSPTNLWPVPNRKEQLLPWILCFLFTCEILQVYLITQPNASVRYKMKCMLHFFHMSEHTFYSHP